MALDCDDIPKFEVGDSVKLYDGKSGAILKYKGYTRDHSDNYLIEVDGDYQDWFYGPPNFYRHPDDDDGEELPEFHWYYFADGKHPGF